MVLPICYHIAETDEDWVRLMAKGVKEFLLRLGGVGMLSKNDWVLATVLVKFLDMESSMFFLEELELDIKKIHETKKKGSNQADKDVNVIFKKLALRAMLLIYAWATRTGVNVDNMLVFKTSLLHTDDRVVKFLEYFKTSFQKAKAYNTDPYGKKGFGALVNWSQVKEMLGENEKPLGDFLTAVVKDLDFVSVTYTAEVEVDDVMEVEVEDVPRTLKVVGKGDIRFFRENFFAFCRTAQNKYDHAIMDVPFFYMADTKTVDTFKNCIQGLEKAASDTPTDEADFIPKFVASLKKVANPKNFSGLVYCGFGQQLLLTTALQAQGFKFFPIIVPKNCTTSLTLVPTASARRSNQKGPTLSWDYAFIIYLGEIEPKWPGIESTLDGRINVRKLVKWGLVTEPTEGVGNPFPYHERNPDPTLYPFRKPLGVARWFLSIYMIGAGCDTTKKRVLCPFAGSMSELKAVMDYGCMTDFLDVNSNVVKGSPTNPNPKDGMLL